MVNSKQKGNAWENTIAKQIRAKFIPAEFDAKTAHNLVHRTPMSGGHVEKGDLIIKPPIWYDFPWFIECRNRQSWSWKNVMERPDDSVIVRWFIEDAFDKCHPYDNDSSYIRFPLLLFTRNQEKTYFCMDYTHIPRLGLVRLDEVFEVFRPCVVIDYPRLDDRLLDTTLVIGSFDTFLSCHGPNFADTTKRINAYLGIDNA